MSFSKWVVVGAVLVFPIISASCTKSIVDNINELLTHIELIEANADSEELEIYARGEQDVFQELPLNKQGHKALLAFHNYILTLNEEYRLNVTVEELVDSRRYLGLSALCLAARDRLRLRDDILQVLLGEQVRLSKSSREYLFISFALSLLDIDKPTKHKLKHEAGEDTSGGIFD